MDRAAKKLILDEAKQKLQPVKERYKLKLKISVEEHRPIKIEMESSKINFLENYIHAKSNLNMQGWENYIFEHDYLFVDTQKYQSDFTGEAKACIAAIYSALGIINIKRNDVGHNVLRDYGHFVSIMIDLKQLKTQEEEKVAHGVSGKIRTMLESGKKSHKTPMK
jgi:hypothetical protein